MFVSGDGRMQLAFDFLNAVKKEFVARQVIMLLAIKLAKAGLKNRCVWKTVKKLSVFVIQNIRTAIGLWLCRRSQRRFVYC